MRKVVNYMLEMDPNLNGYAISSRQRKDVYWTGREQATAIQTNLHLNDSFIETYKSPPIRIILLKCTV